MSFDEMKPPADWDVKQLHEIADVTASNVDKKTVAGERQVRLCNYTDVYENNDVFSNMPFMEATAKQSEIDKFTLKSGDIIITKDSETPDDIGVPTVVREDMHGVLCGYHLSLIRPKTSENDSVFLARQIGSDRIARYFGRQANGSTRFGLNVGPIEQTEIWLAPPEEQRRIAEILDTADEAIQKTEALIAKLKQMKAGLLHDLLTRGIDENGELRTKPKGVLPLGWTFEPLSDISSKLITYGIVQPGPHQPDGVPFVQTKDLKHGELRRSQMDRTSQSIARSYERSAISTNDIVIGIRATVGDCLIVPESLDGANISRGVARISPKGEYDLHFLLWALRSRATQKRLQHAIKGSTYAEITLPALRETLIPVPPEPEQREIALRINTHETRINRESDTLEKLTKIKAGLMHDLLTGKKRVQQLTPASV